MDEQRTVPDLETKADEFELPGLPFRLTASHPGVWRRDEQLGGIVATAPAHTDFYVNPGGPDSTDAASMLNAATLLGGPPPGDFQFSARITVDFRSPYDAGVLLLWIDEQHWGKLCFEFSPAGEPMVVSVVTRGVSDDANAFVVPARTVWLRVSRIDRVWAYHASTDGSIWQMIRIFSLTDSANGHRIGLEAQSPTGDGCTVTFSEIRYVPERLADLRDGS
jgi:regulation of enolase protein 1 (concanavalin A-like superfamily)